MGIKINRSFIFGSVALVFAFLLFGGVILLTSQKSQGKVAGIFTQNLPALTPTGIPTLTPTPTPIPYVIKLISFPAEINAEKTATFTWDIEGAQNIISSTTIYYGNKSNPSQLTRNAAPDDTGYTHAVKDFIKGNYSIPLRFIANEKIALSGTIFFRGYALIDGKHYWTDEQQLNIIPTPHHHISLISYSEKLTPNSTGTFTWEITGPTTTTDYTAIVASHESKPGPLDEGIPISSTPYKTIVTDFTHGSSQIPLRFIGNTIISESGTYFFRAVAFINGKYIWSDEYTFKVE